MLKRIRLWHFIVLPLITISLLLSLWFYLQHILFNLRDLPVFYTHLFYGIRAVISSLAMASLVAWLAIRYRRNYEEEIRKKTEELEKVKDYLYTIINDAAEAIIGMDLNGKVTSWNKAAEQIYGYSEKEMLGKGFEKLLPEHLLKSQELEMISREVSAKGYVKSLITERIRKDGRKICVAITRTALRDKSGNPIGSSAIVRDITKLKEMETKLIESERLAAVGELAASIAHEIKNPLAGIRSASEIIVDSFPYGDPKREMTEESIHQIDRLDRTIKDLLVFAKPKAPVKEECNINDIVNRVFIVLKEDPAGENLKIETRLSENLSSRRADHQQIEQVLFNVGLNSMQAMNHHGTLTIRTYERDSKACISFTDTGTGIPENIRDQIFKPFFTTKARGTGLGLSIVKKIVASHGGEIKIETEEGKGTTFTICLP
ncbi:MAG: ATP-binding protein [Acidobacteriota bacterium]